MPLLSRDENISEKNPFTDLGSSEQATVKIAKMADRENRIWFLSFIIFVFLTRKQLEFEII